ncbi:MAG: hypothetical protein QXF46_01065 [Thermofilaceae archaeon]
MVASELSKTLVMADAQVPVVVVSDAKVPVKTSSGEQLLRKGARLDLSLREALPLIKKGVLALDPERLYSWQELNKIRWIESRDLSAPQQLAGDFYLKARLTVQLLEKSSEGSKKADAAKAMLVDIVRLRLQKILRAVLVNPEFSRDFAERLTIEERALYACLCKVVSDWYSSMKQFLERGDPLG